MIHSAIFRGLSSSIFTFSITDLTIWKVDFYLVFVFHFYVFHLQNLIYLIFFPLSGSETIPHLLFFLSLHCQFQHSALLQLGSSLRPPLQLFLQSSLTMFSQIPALSPNPIFSQQPASSYLSPRMHHLQIPASSAPVPYLSQPQASASLPPCTGLRSSLLKSCPSPGLTGLTGAQSSC